MATEDKKDATTEKADAADAAEKAPTDTTPSVSEGVAEANAEANAKADADDQAKADAKAEAIAESKAEVKTEKAHEAEEEHLIAEPDRVNVGMIGAITFAIIVSTVAVVIGVQQFFTQTIAGEVNKKVYEPEDPAKKELAAVETAKLSKYQWASQKDGIVRIPAARARELVLAEYGKMAAYQPGVSPAPAPSSEPAPSSSVEPATSASVAPSTSVSGMPAPSTSAPPATSASVAPSASASVKKH